MKNFKFMNKLSLGTIFNSAVATVILLEVFFAYSLLIKNLNPQPLPIASNNIVSLDLKAYRETTDLIQGLQNFSPEQILTNNSNPFKYKP